MTTGGIIVIVCILSIFATFSATLAWGVHQTNTALRARDKNKAVASTSAQSVQVDQVLRAA